MGPCLLATSRNTGCMDINEISKIWAQEAIGYTASRLNILSLVSLLNLGAADVCVLGVRLVSSVMRQVVKSYDCSDKQRVLTPGHQG